MTDITRICLENASWSTERGGRNIHKNHFLSQMEIHFFRKNPQKLPSWKWIMDVSRQFLKGCYVNVGIFHLTPFERDQNVGGGIVWSAELPKTSAWVLPPTEREGGGIIACAWKSIYKGWQSFFSLWKPSRWGMLWYVPFPHRKESVA